MSKMFGVRLQDEDAKRLENIIAKRKTTPQEYLKAVIMGELDKVERNWIKVGLDWARNTPAQNRRLPLG